MVIPLGFFCVNVLGGGGKVDDRWRGKAGHSTHAQQCDVCDPLRSAPRQPHKHGWNERKTAHATLLDERRVWGLCLWSKLQYSQRTTFWLKRYSRVTMPQQMPVTNMTMPSICVQEPR